MADYPKRIGKGGAGKKPTTAGLARKKAEAMRAMKSTAKKKRGK